MIKMFFPSEIQNKSRVKCRQMILIDAVNERRTSSKILFNEKIVAPLLRAGGGRDIRVFAKTSSHPKTAMPGRMYLLVVWFGVRL